MDRDVGVNPAAFANRSAHVDALRARLPEHLHVFPQHRHALGRNLDLQTRHGTGEKIVAVPFTRAVVRGLAWCARDDEGHGQRHPPNDEACSA